MKNYYSSKRKAPEYFILKYEIKNSKIIIYFADGKTKEETYSKELENQIIENMENQLSDTSFYNLKTEIKENMQTSKNLSVVSSGLFVIFSASSYIGELPLNTVETIPVIVLSAICAGSSLIKQHKFKALLQDLTKNHRFIVNKELFENLDSSQTKLVISKQDSKTKAALTGEININAIDPLTKNQVTNLIDTARQMKSKNYVYKK